MDDKVDETNTEAEGEKKTPTDAESKESSLPSSSVESTPCSIPPSNKNVTTKEKRKQEEAAALKAKPSKTPANTKPIMHTSTKEMYRILAAQCGIACTMTDGCRCMDCQANYFDCEYDDSEHNKTDGGLGAGTPMFISELMHGSSCTIL